MKLPKITLSLFAVLCTSAAFSSAIVAPRDYYGKIAQRLANMFPEYHVLHQQLDDSVSRRAWTNLVTGFDYDHSVFLKGDLERLARRMDAIDDEIKQGDVSFGYTVYNVYLKRLQDRILFATNLLATVEWDFSTNETYRVKRKDAEWPATVEEAEDLWRRRIKNEVLVAVLERELDAEKKPPTNGAPAYVITNVTSDLIKKYVQYSTVLTTLDDEAVLQHYLSAVTRSYDPHSDYLSPTSKEDFEMEMNLTLSGVGAVLQMDDGALKIVEVMPGGPVERDGRIKVGDRIVGVQQGDGEMEDIMWQPMNKSIRKIRGRKGTRVTLEIIPRNDPSGIARRRYELVRDEIKLEDQAATGRVETVSNGDCKYRLGYVFLPSFYGTMGRHENDPGFRSCAYDVAKIIADFNAEDVDGMVLDLRGNGGGALNEAVVLSSLFVSGDPDAVNKACGIRRPVRGTPCVQICGTDGVGSLVIGPENRAIFYKPLVVLTDRASASASEIVAGHLADCGRAIVVGDSTTHGKGTVQTVMAMGNSRYGSCKITTARFYRVNGHSTQVEGVPADIHLPSLLDSLDIGEDKLPNALPFSRILPADYTSVWNIRRFIPQLKERSDVRLKDDVRYQKHVANVEQMKQISDRVEVPLEREARKAMLRSDRDLRELGDDTDDEEKEDQVVSSRRKRNEKPADDIVLEEGFRILADLVELSGGELLPKPRNWWE